MPKRGRQLLRLVGEVRRHGRRRMRHLAAPSLAAPSGCRMSRLRSCVVHSLATAVSARTRASNYHGANRRKEMGCCNTCSSSQQANKPTSLGSSASGQPPHHLVWRSWDSWVAVRTGYLFFLKILQPPVQYAVALDATHTHRGDALAAETRTHTPQQTNGRRTYRPTGAASGAFFLFS
jgi:hypothetical protein